jgi:hypothetical protein
LGSSLPHEAVRAPDSLDRPKSRCRLIRSYRGLHRLYHRVAARGNRGNPPNACNRGRFL